MPTNIRETSRRRTPWDGNQKLSPIEEFIQEKYHELYDTKHQKLNETKEYQLVNSYKLEKCKFCNSNNIVKKGFTQNKIQRYVCLECHKSFNVLTNTIFDNHKIAISEWIEFCLNIFRYSSTSNTSKNNKNSFNTSNYWLQKLFLTVAKIQETIVLQDKVQIDETFYKVALNERKTQYGKELRGLSTNQYCIGIGYDGTYVYAKLEGVGKTSKKKTCDAFLKHINENSLLIHDKEKSHKILVEKLQLRDESYNSHEIKKLPDKENPLYEINHQCYLLKKFLNAHSGFDRDDLQNYINLFCFIQNPPFDLLEKVKIVLDSAIRNPKTLKYRDLFNDKHYKY